MNKLCTAIALLLMALINTSCLKSGLDDLETYDQNDITNIRFEYRWWDEANKQMRVIEMEVDKTIDNENKQVNCTLKVPATTANFTEDIRKNVSLSALSLNVDVSTAASVIPLDNAPQMGYFPSDFSGKTYKYKIVAANGNAANWTITISDFQK